MSDSGSPVVWRFRRPSVQVPSVPLQLPARNPVKRPSRRQRVLQCKFLAHQAIEADSNDDSISGSQNSDDDNENTDLSCMTNASISVDDDDMAIYRDSMGSQAGDLGFGTPLAETRRGRFKSSYDQSRTPTWDFAGTICPQNHMCRLRNYKNADHHCDLCQSAIEEGTKGVCILHTHTHTVL